MPHPTRPTKALRDQLGALFGTDIDCALAIMTALSEEDQREFGARDLVAATDYRLIDVLVAVARLTTAGLIAHPAAGRYRCLGSQRSRRTG
jgi:hypothetical protein